MTPNATWKSVERKVGAALGGKRTGAVGSAGPDVLTPWLAVQVKHRAALPQWMTEALAGVRAQAGGQRLGLVVLHPKGARTGDSVVMMALADFRAWFVGEADGDPLGGDGEAPA